MSIEAMKQALATIDKIIDGCNNVQEEKDIHGDAKTLAKLIKKDCFPTLEALCQAIAEAEKQEPVAWVDVKDSYEGPYEFHGIERMGVGKHLLYLAPVHARPVVHTVRCTYPQCQATNGCVGACSKGQPDLARVGEVGVWGDKREWVGLTEGEVHDAFNFVEFIKQISFDRDRPEWCENFAAYIEAKLKEKNS